MVDRGMTAMSRGNSTTGEMTCNGGERKEDDDFYIFSGLRDLPEKAIENLICVHHPKLAEFFKKTLEYYSLRKIQDGETDFFGEHQYFYEDLPYPEAADDNPRERSASPDSSVICLDYEFVMKQRNKRNANDVPDISDTTSAVNDMIMEGARADINDSSSQEPRYDQRDSNSESPNYPGEHRQEPILEEADLSEPDADPQEPRSLASYFEEIGESEKVSDSAASPFNEQEIRMGESAVSRPGSPSVLSRFLIPIREAITQMTLETVTPFHRPIDEISLASGQLVIDEGDEDESIRNESGEDGVDGNSDKINVASKDIRRVHDDQESDKEDVINDDTEVNIDGIPEDAVEEPVAKKSCRSESASSHSADESEEPISLSALPPPPAPPSRTTMELELQKMQRQLAIDFSVPPPPLMLQPIIPQPIPFSPFSVPPPTAVMPNFTHIPSPVSPMQFPYPRPFMQPSSPIIPPSYHHGLPGSQPSSPMILSAYQPSPCGPFSPLPTPQFLQIPPPPRCLFPMQNPFGPNSPM